MLAIIVERFQILLFPVYLILIEVAMRLSLNINSSAFIGPTLAAVGIGFIIPLTIQRDVTKRFPPKSQDAFKRRNATPYDTRERVFAGIARIILWCLITSWCFSLYFSAAKPTKQFCCLPLSLDLGFVNYTIAVSLSFAKDIIFRKDKI